MSKGSFIDSFSVEQSVLKCKKIDKHKVDKIYDLNKSCFHILIRFFENINDFRIDRRKKYSLPEILLCTFIGILYGSKSYYDIVQTCNHKIKALRMFLPYKNGIPSHDTINRIMCILDSQHMEYVFRKSMIKICGSLKGKHIAIDGKAIKNAVNSDSNDKCIMVSAFVCGDCITLAQEKVKEKSNEIKSVPEIIKVLILNETVLTMDAMGMQRETIALIVKRGGDYVVCLKKNQGKTYDDVELVIKHVAPDDIYIEHDKQSGKVIERRYKIYKCIDLMQESYRWENLKTIVCVEKTTYHKGKEDNETRYFLSSLNVNAFEHSKIIRSHWQIENNLHRTLDVFFGEDESTKRRGNSAQNFSLLRKLSLSCLNKYFPSSMRLKDKQMDLLLDDELLYNFIMSFQSDTDI